MAALTLSAPDIRTAKRLVVKIGSALLVDRKTGLKQGWLSALAITATVTFGYKHGTRRQNLRTATSSGYGGRFAPSGFPRRWCASRVITIFS